MIKLISSLTSNLLFISFVFIFRVSLGESTYRKNSVGLQNQTNIIDMLIEQMQYSNFLLNDTNVQIDLNEACKVEILDQRLKFSHIDCQNCEEFSRTLKYNLPARCLADPYKPIVFNFTRDVLAFVHMQKTGGSRFNRFLTSDIVSDPRCECKLKFVSNLTGKNGGKILPIRRKTQQICLCHRPNSHLTTTHDQKDSPIKANEIDGIYEMMYDRKLCLYNDTFEQVKVNIILQSQWLHTRATFSWSYCGVHAGYHRLRNCVPYATILDVVRKDLWDLRNKSGPRVSSAIVSQKSTPENDSKFFDDMNEDYDDTITQNNNIYENITTILQKKIISRFFRKNNIKMEKGNIMQKNINTSADLAYLNFYTRSKMDTNRYHMDPVENYYYITLLRNPLSRYISEFKIVKRGKAWPDAYVLCPDNKIKHALTCYKNSTSSKMALKEFMICRNNWASNRMTRHLCDPHLLDICFTNTTKLRHLSKEQLEHLMLESAKYNLKFGIKFFGLLENVKELKKMIKITFGPEGPDINKFIAEHYDYAIIKSHNETLKIRHQILKMNHLDVELYKFARQLFFNRYRKWGGVNNS
ncbi:unnamed protein product [Gordionus sp. m RMFG-2023]